MIRLTNSHISVTLSEPVGDDAYYRGTRFNRSGAFVSIDSSLPVGGSVHVKIKADYDAKYGAPTTAKLKVFFKYFYVNTTTGEKSGDVLLEGKLA